MRNDDQPTAPPETPSDEPPARELWAPRISVVIGLILACAYAFGGAGVGDFCLDDAWIHLAYAKSLSLGEGLSYNPGDQETGFSSPLWVAALAVWPTEPDPVGSVKLLGALLHAATAGLASAIALDLVHARASVARPMPAMSIALLAGILTATSPTLLQGASSGMEVPLTTCLLLACLRTSLREQWLLAGVLGFAVELARPEALACLLGFAALAWLGQTLAKRGLPGPERARAGLRSLVVATPALGAGLGLGLWVVYCELVSGWPWPNTAYVKSTLGQASGLGSGLDYLGAQVLPWQPWFVGVGGLALIAAAVWTDLSDRGVLDPRDSDSSSRPEPPRRRWQLSALLVAYLAGMLGTAITRPLNPDTLFYEARYFAIFAAIPPIVIALGVARTHRVLGVVLILPIALLTGLQIPAAHTIQRAQERGIALLHSDPARLATRELPADARVAVEGAGAMRYRTPRAMTIIDVIGLNDAAIAHAPDDAAKACVLVERAPQYFVLPDHIAAPLSRVFELRVLAEFVDPASAQVAEPHEVRVLLLEVLGVRERWRGCVDQGDGLARSRAPNSPRAPKLR
ncbi:hypothetical protein ENSA5_31900 [Enhygromyxa salina]|uniref:Glycosyltransferase RgtA/B/C/D-like domain-containing protein n=1 Tax=Enhygromyxa salina TaxID=215803 RepID=A0A2S9XXW6_9BACT|nr:hypothetical protein [Enhygromyxa salina]PRP97683.1 hypothetical protein ENSA5_31900 [Enhygromyxa salina]